MLQPSTLEFSGGVNKVISSKRRVELIIFRAPSDGTHSQSAMLIGPILGWPIGATFCAFVSRPFVAHNCTSMRRPFFHGNAALSRAMTQAFGPRARSCAFGARTELIIGTWNGSAAGSLGGEADARPRAPPSSFFLFPFLSRMHYPAAIFLLCFCIISVSVSVSFCLVMNVHLIVAFAWALRSLRFLNMVVSSM